MDNLKRELKRRILDVKKCKLRLDSRQKEKMEKKHMRLMTKKRKDKVVD